MSTSTCSYEMEPEGVRDSPQIDIKINLSNEFKKYFPKISQQPVLENEPILSEIFKWLPIPDLISCRLVNKIWSSSALTQLDSMPYPPILLMDKRPPPGDDLKEPNAKAHRNDNMSLSTLNFVFRNPSAHPLIYSRFRIAEYALAKLKISSEELRFFEKYSSKIKYLELHSFADSVLSVGVTPISHSLLLQRTPVKLNNLTTLKLYGKSFYDEMGEPPAYQFPGADRLYRVNVSPSSSMYKDLPRLKSLQFMPDLTIPLELLPQVTEFLKDLLSIAPALSTLQLPEFASIGGDEKLLDALAEPNLTLNSLETLVLKNMNPMILRKLLKISGEKGLKLKRLILQFEKFFFQDFTREFFNRKFFISFLEVHKDSLEVLNILNSHQCVPPPEEEAILLQEPIKSCFPDETMCEFGQADGSNPCIEFELEALKRLILPIESVCSIFDVISNLHLKTPSLTHLHLLVNGYEAITTLSPYPSCKKYLLWKVHKELWNQLASIPEPLLHLSHLSILNPICTPNLVAELARVFPNLRSLALCFYGDIRAESVLNEVWEHWNETLEELTIFALQIPGSSELKVFSQSQVLRGNPCVCNFKRLVDFNIFGRIILELEHIEKFGEMKELRRIRAEMEDEDAAKALCQSLGITLYTDEEENFTYWLRKVQNVDEFIV